jgi:hypothetical protein
MKNKSSLLFVILAMLCCFFLGTPVIAGEVSGKAVPEVGAYGVDGVVNIIVGNPCDVKEQIIVGASDIVMGTGEYSIVGIPAGEYYLSAQISLIDNLAEWWAGDESTPHCSKAKKLKIGEIDSIKNVNFSLDKAASLAGRIYAGAGIPLKDALVEVYTGSPCGSHKLISSNVTSRNGSYLLGMLPSGYYFLKVNPKDYQSAWWAESKSTSQCNEAQAITLTKGLAVTGKDVYVTEEGLQVSGFTFDATEKGRTVYPDVSLYTGDPCGVHTLVKSSKAFRKNSTYSIGGLAKGRYYAKARGYTSVADPEGLFIPEWWAGEESSAECKKAKAIVLSNAEGRSDINFQLDHGGVISGTLHRGAEVIGQERPMVQAYSGDPCGDHTLIAVNDIGTMDGRYAITALSAGTYYLKTKSITGSAARWWGGANSGADCKMAKPVTIESGQRVSDNDFYPEAKKQ